MLFQHLSEQILNSLNFPPTKGQHKLIEILAQFVVENDKKILILKGYAGTGKTSVISAFVKVLQNVRLRSVLLAPTGRAAKVFSSYADRTASTIHKKIYIQKSSKDGFGNFSLAANLHSATFFVVDEASMISNRSSNIALFGSGDLLSDIIKYVYNDKNCKLILIGDDAQLPPVGSDESPALDNEIMQTYGIDIVNANLNEVVRQSNDSGILFNATTIRKSIESDSFNKPKLKTSHFDDFKRISGVDLLEEISNSYDKSGIEDTIVICRSNKRANKFNMGIRSQILYREEEICIGDLLMVVKNNYTWAADCSEIDFIANGDIVEVVRIHSYEELYDKRYANVTIRLIDYNELELEVKILLDTLTIDSAALPSEDHKAYFYKILEDYSELDTKKKQYAAVRENEYFNALQVKFAYAITCHKAQGGQWKTVFIDQGYLTDDMINKEFLRWLYTAFTRASKNLYLINFNDDFFE